MPHLQICKQDVVLNLVSSIFLSCWVLVRLARLIRKLKFQGSLLIQILTNIWMWIRYKIQTNLFRSANENVWIQIKHSICKLVKVILLHLPSNRGVFSETLIVSNSRCGALSFKIMMRVSSLWETRSNLHQTPVNLSSVFTNSSIILGCTK